MQLTEVQTHLSECCPGYWIEISQPANQECNWASCVCWKVVWGTKSL